MKRALSKTLSLVILAAALSGGHLMAAEGIRLEASSVDGNTSLNFGQVKSLETDGSPVTGVASKEMILTVHSDLNARYTISQITNAPPIGSAGSICPVDAVRYTARIKNGSGEIRTPSRSVLRQGTEDIFISGQAGSDVELVILYELAVPAGQTAGHYNASITYKVSTL